MLEQTLSIIKPDATGKNAIGNVISMIEGHGLKIVAAKMLRLSRSQAEEFYGVHKGKPFFERLCEFMISGPIMVMVLEKENAIEHYRYLMGAAQDPSPGTIRCMYGISINHNAVHGSDSPETAKTEIGFFFSSYELNELKGKTNA